RPAHRGALAAQDLRPQEWRSAAGGAGTLAAALRQGAAAAWPGLRLHCGMDRGRPVTGWRAATFAAALFAITLNFLQPLAHAALLRDGGPVAAASLWGAFCIGM